MKIVERFILNKKIFPYLLLSVAGIFLVIALSFAHQLPSRVDEGSFLIKGYYYWSGKYRPFEEYGPWTNNMPLAYIIPGMVQYLFGPGLLVGRYFMIFLAILTFTALFLSIRRLKGKWWAFLTVFPFAINPSLISVYVQAISEGLVACLLAWALFFIIGEDRKDWHIATGSLLSALTILTRQNMVLLAPFIIIYAFWLCNRRAGWIALIFTAIPLLIGHIVYYPDIFKLWTPWLPGFIRQFLHIVGLEGGGVQAWQPKVDFFTRVTSFFLTLRYHFLAIFSIFISFFSLPLKRLWFSSYERKLVFLLSLTFFVFFGMHAWAALAKNYCVFCLSSYVSFFLPLAIIAGAISIINLLSAMQDFSPYPIILFFIFTFSGAFLGNLETVGRWIMVLPVPRLSDGRIKGGFTELWLLFKNRFDWSYDQLLRVIPPIVGLLTVFLLMLLLVGVYLFFRKRISIVFGRYILISLLVIGFLLTPSYFLGGDPLNNPCGGDVLAAYEQVGAHLQNIIPDGTTVYWGGGSVVTPLLYITNSEFHPQQLNGIYSARRGGDRSLLERDGYFNEESLKAWRESDEFILIENINLVGFWKTFLLPQSFNEYQASVPLDPCNAASYIRIFRRKY